MATATPLRTNQPHHLQPTRTTSSQPLAPPPPPPPNSHQLYHGRPTALPRPPPPPPPLLMGFVFLQEYPRTSTISPQTKRRCHLSCRPRCKRSWIQKIQPILHVKNAISSPGSNVCFNLLSWNYIPDANASRRPTTN